jgi:tetratricopeptide (TPR) repeat protein
MLRSLLGRSLALALLLTALLGLMAAAPAYAADVDLGVIVVKQKIQAEALRTRLIKGEPFEALAREYSVGPAAGRGGRLGLVPEDRLRAEYRQSLRELRPGVPSQIIPTEEGFTLLMRFDQPGGAAAQAMTPDRGRAPAPAAPAATPAAPAQAQARGQGIPDSPQLVARQEVAAGLEALARGQFKEAEKTFSKALGQNPREDSATFLLDIVRLAQAGKYNQQAVSAFAEGFLAMIEPNPSQALVGFRKSAQIDPGFWPGVLFEANTLAGMGRIPEARQLFDKTLAINPKADRAYLSLGLMAIDERKVDEAASHFRKALEINPELSEAHYRLGTLAMFKGEMGAAEREFNAALAIDPFKEEALNDLALVYGMTGRVQDAERVYRKALELSPAFPAPHINLGNLYAQTGRVNQAIEEFNKALMIDPRIGDVHVNLAAAYIMKEDWARAREHADLAAKLGAQVPEVVLKKLAERQGKK